MNMLVKLAAGSSDGTARLPAGPLIRTFDRDIPVAMRLERPALALLHGVLSVDECAAFIALGRHRPRAGAVVALRPAETPFVARIERRLAELMNVALRNDEGLELRRCHAGTRLPPRDDARGRAACLEIFLNDVEAGGETLFPALGLAITPRAGHAVHLGLGSAHGELDLRAVRVGAPVEAGDKWLLTKWVREAA